MRAHGTSDERRQQARAELGQTAVSPAAARALVGACLALLLGVPALELAHGLRAGFAPLALGEPPAPPAVGGALGQALAWGARAARALGALEARLDEGSLLTRLLQPGLVPLLDRLGAHHARVVPGRDGFWFYRPDVESLVGPGFLSPGWLAERRRAGPAWAAPPEPDPRPAVRELAAALEARGIRLVLLPVPGKPAIHPDALAWPDALAGRAPENPSRAEFLAEVARVAEVLDVAPLLRAMRVEGREAYLRTDTHWRPEAVERVAGALAVRLRREVSFAGEELDDLSRRFAQAAQVGDTVRLRLPPPADPGVPPERVELQAVERGDGPLRPEPGAEVLVLGDSFANVYSQASLGWGEGAGLAEQLAFALRRPVDLLARNAGGPRAARQALADELARGRDRLSGKRVVVWVFAERELSLGDWGPTPWVPGPARAPSFLVPGAPREVLASVAAIGWVPLPGRVPYGEHLTSVRLVDLAPLSGPGLAPGAEALAYAPTLHAQAWTEAARWRPGDRVRVRLGPFDEGRLGALARSELAGLELEPHALAEPLEPEAGLAAEAQAPGWPEAGAALAAALLGALAALLGWRREAAA
ncbi:MAG TPA: hypothetical protein PK668_22755 [Myxococcota bacterium]|nr:hypothetical protein [Myxococcota bacterium]HRY95515.1 hypothetical protein [Myxococcota bacterium]HSA22980.1 hypothetical protein [Myxococcota bacterium]